MNQQTADKILEFVEHNWIFNQIFGGYFTDYFPDFKDFINSLVVTNCDSKYEIACRMYRDEYLTSDYHRDTVYPKLKIGDETYNNKLGLFHPFLSWLSQQKEQDE